MPVRVRWVATPIDVPVQRTTTQRRGLRIASLTASATPFEMIAASVRLPDLSGLPTARERAIHLLEIAAEVEHQLLVQYLYAASSLRDPGDPNLPAGASSMIATWRKDVVEIAREEMGHLLTVQNLLVLLASEPHFDRSRFPTPVGLYPFELSLRPFDRAAVATYVAAEHPGFVQPDAGLKEILALAQASVGMEVNPVGALYALIIALFEPADRMAALAESADPSDRLVAAVNAARNVGDLHLGPSDFAKGTLPFQSSADDWGFDPEKVGDQAEVFVRTADNRDQALQALREIAVQGEGKLASDPAVDESHYRRFREVFEALSSLPPGDVAHPVPADPTVGGTEPASSIEHPRARRWAQLFDLRYEMLLAALAHFTRLAGPLYVDSGPRLGDRTARGLLHLWAFDEMRHIAKIAGKLVQLPRAGSSSALRAGPPFTMPSSIALPPDEPARWNAHRSRYAAAAVMIQDLQQHDATDGADEFLAFLLRTDAAAEALATRQRDGEPLLPQPDAYRKVTVVLEESVRGFTVRKHGNFWRGVSRDTFIGTPVFGLPLVAPGAGGNFDPESSNLMKAIEGRAPFGPAGAFPRMPAGRPAVPKARADFIRKWIQDGCPDPLTEPGVEGEPDPRSEPADPGPEDGSMSRFQQVISLLDNAVGGSAAGVGAHGAFWRNKPRAEFVAMSVFGQKLIVVGSGSDSNLVKALKGQNPFGADVGTGGAVFRRMPAGRPPMSPADVTIIEKWIDDGCPD